MSGQTPELNLAAELQALRQAFETLQTECRTEFANIRAEILQARVARAEAYSNHIRNWVGLLSLIIALVLALAGFVGIKSMSDLASSREKTQRVADEVQRNADSVSKAANVVQKANQLVEGLQPEVQTMQSKLGTMQPQLGAIKVQLNEFKVKYQDLQRSDEKFRNELKQAANTANKADINTSNLQANSSFPGYPLITNVPIAGVHVGIPSTLNGRDFGGAKGILRAKFQSIAKESDVVELETSSWADDTIGFTLTQSEFSELNQKWQAAPDLVTGINQMPFMAFQVVTAEGKSSGWSLTSMLLLPPSGLTVTVQ